MKKLFVAVGVIVLLLLVSGLICFAWFGGFSEFTVYSCGSGFYFNRTDLLTYSIPELDVRSEGNSFYLEDYFVSEELGTEYKIKGKLFNVGSVYLAKKSDHYDPKQYTFDICDYQDQALVITAAMQYVTLTSSQPDKAMNVYLHVEERTLPLDLTLKEVNICATGGTPALFLGAFADINMILQGENCLSVGQARHTLPDFVRYFADDVLNVQESLYYKTLQGVQKNHGANGQTSSDQYMETVGDLLVGVGESWMDLLDGMTDVLNGVDGMDGMNGLPALVHPCGISFAGSGSLSLQGGGGGQGGAPSKGLLGSHDSTKGKWGGNGKQGNGKEIANPKEE